MRDVVERSRAPGATAANRGPPGQFVVLITRLPADKPVFPFERAFYNPCRQHPSFLESLSFFCKRENQGARDQGGRAWGVLCFSDLEDARACQAWLPSCEVQNEEWTAAGAEEAGAEPPVWTIAPKQVQVSAGGGGLHVTAAAAGQFQP